MLAATAKGEEEFRSKRSGRKKKKTTQKWPRPITFVLSVCVPQKPLASLWFFQNPFFTRQTSFLSTPFPRALVSPRLNLHNSCTRWRLAAFDNYSTLGRCCSIILRSFSSLHSYYQYCINEHYLLSQIIKLILQTIAAALPSFYSDI